MTQNYSNLDKAQSYQELLEENVELRKAVSKLQNVLTKEHSEKETLKKIHSEFKEIHERTRKELHELNTKLLNSYAEKSTLEKRLDQELAKQKSLFEKQKESYENQLLKLSMIDAETLKNKIQAECEISYREKLESKSLEIDTLSDQVFELKKREELALTEYETFKSEALKEIEHLKDAHKSEVRELLFKIQILSDKNENSYDRETFKELKNDIDLLRKQNSEYLNELNSLRREKEQLQLDRNDVKLSLMKELDSEKLRSKMISAENERNSHLVKTIEDELTALKHKLDEKNDEVKFLIEEKYNLAKELRDKENDFETFRAEVKILRQKIDERDNEVFDTLKETSEKEKQRFLNEKHEKEELMGKIEELGLNLRDIRIEYKNFYERANNEIHIYKRDFHILSEEKRNLQNRILELQQDLEYIREDYDRKFNLNSELESALGSLQEKYRELSNREAESHKVRFELEGQLKSKSQELEEAYRTMVKGTKTQNSLNAGTMGEKRFQELWNKKEYYKLKVHYVKLVQTVK